MTLKFNPIKKASIKNLTIFCLVLAAFFAPIGATGISINVGFGELSLFRLFLLCAIIFRLIECIYSNTVISVYNRNNKYTICFFTCWFIYACVSIVWAYDLSNFVRILFFLGSGLLIIYLVSDICKIQELNKLLRAFNFGLFVQALMGLYEFSTGRWFFLKQISVEIYQSRNLRYPVAMMGNPNDFATGMFLGIVICLYFSYNAQNSKKNRLLNLFMALLYFIMITLSNSRASLIGALICISFVFYKRRNSSSKVLIIALVILILMAPGVMTYIMTHVDLEYYQTQGESFSNRINLIRNGFVFLIKTFGFGVGNGQIEYWMRNNAFYATGNIENMHNWWMELLTAYGLLVFIGFFVFYLNTYRSFLHRFVANRNTSQGKQMLVFAGSFLGLVVVLVSSSSNMTKEFMWLFWAICISFQKNGNEEHVIKDLLGEL